MGTPLIALVMAEVPGKGFFPYVKTEFEEIAITYREGNVKFGRKPPTHITVEESLLYGHKILAKQNADGTYTLSAARECDDDWVDRQNN